MAQSKIKTHKVLFIILGIIAAVLVIAYFQFDKIVENLVRTKLTGLIDQSPDKFYDYEFQNLDINLITGSLTFNKLGLIPAEHAFDSLKSNTGKLRSIIEVHMDEITLTGFEIRKFLDNGTLDIDNFLIFAPQIKVFINPDKAKITSEKSDVIQDLLTDNFISATLNKFEIIDGNLEFYYINQNTKPLSIESTHLLLTHAYADQETLQKFIPLDYQSISFTSTGISMDISEEIGLTSDTIYFDVNQATIRLSNFQIVPKFSREAFAARHEFQRQWVALTVDGLVLKDIQLAHFEETGNIVVNKVEVKSPKLELYKDKTKPTPPFKKKPLPGTEIRNLPVIIDIDSISVVQALITINEKSPLTQETSNMIFNNLNALITNFTNDPVALATDQFMIADIHTQVMNKANTHMNLKFDLLNKEDDFIGTGHMDSVEAAVFNDVLVPMAAVKIEQGLIHSMDFEFNSMDTVSTGIMNLEYADIRVKVLNPDSRGGKKQGFKSFAANTVVKTNNSKLRGNYIEGIINTTRVLDKNVFPYLWHSIQSGLVSTLVPMSNKKDAKAQQKEARKELRQQKKEESRNN